MLTDSALIKEVKKRNRKALGELHDRFAPVLLGLSMRYCGNRADAEDVLHDAFIKILGGIDNFIEKPESSFEGWMKRITINTALNFLRARSRMSFADLDPIAEEAGEGEEEEISFASLSDVIGKKEILGMLCELPHGYRTVFNLYVFEQYSHKEIAEVMNCTENTSKSQLSKARAALRTKISKVLEGKSIIS